MRSKFLLLVYPILLVGLLTGFWVETVVASISDSSSGESLNAHPSLMLSAFTATVTGNDQVRLQWLSEYERELLGFNLYRYLKPDASDSSRINEKLITGYQDNEGIKTYSYLDDAVSTDNEYYYMLEAIDEEMISDYYGPVKVNTVSTPEVQQSAKERKTKLLGVYPNPYNLGTNIRFELKESSTIQIVIYNLLGQRITSITQALDSGESTMYWDGRDKQGNVCHSGIYFYHFVTADGYEKYDKMILMT